MTEVIFHFNVLDKSDHVCRYVRKAVANTRRVAVVADAQWLQQIDRDMWAISATEFLTHCRTDAPPAMQSASGVVLCDAAAQSPHQDILVNLGMAVPEGFGRFERLVELVGSDDDDRAASRQRWKFYRDRGYTLSSVDMQAAPGRQAGS
jgi:DNA polymerase-3 subunit chi